MTSAPTKHAQSPNHQRVPDPHRPLRLELKPTAPATGQVDGAWWPYSRDLRAEVPALVRALGRAEGAGSEVLRVERLSYNLLAWGPTDGEVDVDGFVVRLGGFRSQHANTIDVIGHHQRLTLLVIPPEPGAAAGHRALTTAAQTGNAGSIEQLLRAAPGL